MKTAALITAADMPEEINVGTYQNSLVRIYSEPEQTVTQHQIEAEQKRAMAIAYVDRNRYRYI